LRSKIASAELPEILKKAGAKVQDAAVYTAEKQKSKSEWLIEEINNGRIDWLTFASPSSVDSFFSQISAELMNSADVKVASIGPVTSERLRTHGVNVDITAAEHTLGGLIDVIDKTYR
jgi:uroporphyrinogen III methyltransferase/synthase